MGEVYTFHETVIGHMHVLNQIPCEDASQSFSAEDDRYHIAIVADGHGSKSCFRSRIGSKTAADVALDCLRQFAETNLETPAAEERFYHDIFTNARYRQMSVRQLTDTILGIWHNRVMEDYENNPPTQEEMGASAAEYENGENLTHIYGTTLIAALQLPKCLILIHQGDGRCDVFYEDGTIDQPIPWDSRCEDTATTSLCDDDAAEGFRHCVLNLVEKPVIACYLGSDGVEDAYRDTYEDLGGSHILMGGVHTFYKDLTCQLSELGPAEFEQDLKTMLPEFSKSGRFSKGGSGDDVSVAGIVDLDAIASYVQRYKDEVKLYDLEEKLSWKEDELRSKERKHGILEKRVKELYHEAKLSQDKIKFMQERRNRLEELRDQLTQQIADKEEYIKGCGQEIQETKSFFDRPFYFLPKVKIQHFYQEITNPLSNEESGLVKLKEDLAQCKTQIQQALDEQLQEKNNLNGISDRLMEAKKAYEEYDAKYQEINTIRKGIEDEIKVLKTDSAYLN
jgi:hypothetical protein